MCTNFDWLQPHCMGRGPKHVDKGCASAIIHPWIPLFSHYGTDSLGKMLVAALKQSSLSENLHHELNRLVRSGCGSLFIRCVILYRVFTCVVRCRLALGRVCGQWIQQAWLICCCSAGPAGTLLQLLKRGCWAFPTTVILI